MNNFNSLLPAISDNMNHGMQNALYCKRCGYGGCDVRVMHCGCSAHARCIDVSNAPLMQCPYCFKSISGLALYPMSFHEVDNAKRTAAAQLKSKQSLKKRKASSEPQNSTQSNILDGLENDNRTGRWTLEETALCDKLIDRFKAGDLPVKNGVKLNDFLANMLKSKQSRLTKKMKNANLSGKQFTKTNGYIANIEECKQFSELEDGFFRSISDPLEQASMRFHMQKEWRELFSNYCIEIGQPLDVDMWLNSVEEMEKRESLAKDSARMAKRKVMMGIALDQDIQNPDNGVFIDSSMSSRVHTFDSMKTDHGDILGLVNEKPMKSVKNGTLIPKSKREYWYNASPFLGKVISYIQRHGLPFEHVDAWVPSFVPDVDASEGSGVNNDATCRLCFGGSATTDVYIPSDGVGQPVVLSSDDQFNLLSFGDYSQKFSFNLGCGLPGRIYETGVPAWEQSVQNAPHHHFERCGGAMQWGIKTVVGVPVPSPSVGRIVVLLYSKFDRKMDQELVGKLYSEFKKFVPSPKWKLIVDMGINSDKHNQASQAMHVPNNTRVSSNDAGMINDIITILGENMPHDQSSPFFSYLSSFMSLRLMLLKLAPSPEERDQRALLLSSYQSYLSNRRSRSEIAVMIARDYMFLKQQSQSNVQNSPRLQGAIPNLQGQVSNDQFNLSLNNGMNGSNNNNPMQLHSLNHNHHGQAQQNIAPFNAFQQQPQHQQPQHHQIMMLNHQQNHQEPQQHNPIEISNHSHINLSSLSNHGQGNVPSSSIGRNPDSET